MLLLVLLSGMLAAGDPDPCSDVVPVPQSCAKVTGEAFGITVRQASSVSWITSDIFANPLLIPAAEYVLAGGCWLGDCCKSHGCESVSADK